MIRGAGNTRSRFRVAKFRKLAALICHTQAKLMGRPQTPSPPWRPKVFRSSPPRQLSIVEECGTLGAMEYTPADDENVSADKINICLEHQLGIKGVSAGPDTAGPEKRECWYGDDYDCLKGFLREDCDSNEVKWCWSAWNTALRDWKTAFGDWKTCDSEENC